MRACPNPAWERAFIVYAWHDDDRVERAMPTYAITQAGELLKSDDYTGPFPPPWDAALDRAAPDPFLAPRWAAVE